MIEKKRRSGKSIKRVPKREPKTGKKKRAEKWFSLDSLMGKGLCILLVVILTVGAFLAPKMINNLYDAGTLMQITYVDMDLSTYAVAYTSFQEKLMAIARAKTAGDRLVALSAEETDEKISDEELVRFVNQEMEEKAGDVLLCEDWWSRLSGENLISREKVTVYAQTQMSSQDDTAGAEMAPIQFWILSFEITDEQKTYRKYEYEEMMKTEKVQIAGGSPEYVTDRLIVCLDADFYKIYAMATAGDELGIMNMYGWDLPMIFTVDLKNRYWADDDMYLRMDLTDMSIAGWADYWEVLPEDKDIYLNIQGELSGCMAFLDGQAETVGADAAAEETGSGTSSASAGNSMESVTVIEKMNNGEYDAYILDSASDTAYGNMDGENKKEILLEVGVSGNFAGSDNSVWIQKSGCRDFFEMMQF